MKVLIYGVGVIGSLTVHALCKAGNDVTVVARGSWKEVLEKRGLTVKTHSGEKEWTDHPRVLSEYDGDRYDVAFSIMQNQQQWNMLDILAGVQANYIVLTGNNMQSADMEQKLEAEGCDPKKILFAFQTSGGQRHKDYTEIVTFGRTEFTIGHRNRELNQEEKEFFRQLFQDSEMKLSYMDDMESWYRCHAAFVLPIAYLAYMHHCNLEACGWKDADAYVRAVRESYAFLWSVGTKIRPKNDDRNLIGIRSFLLKFILWIAAKTKLGELAAGAHCRNAVTEMQFLDERFQELRTQNPAFPLPTFDSLRSEMPDWEQLHRQYDKTGRN